MKVQKTDEKWKYFHGSDLPREDHEVFIDTWLKKAICKLNPEICDSPLKADEIIYKLRSILVEVENSGLVSANEIFNEWIRGEKSMPLGKDGEHITINLIDFGGLPDSFD